MLNKGLLNELAPSASAGMLLPPDELLLEEELEEELEELLLDEALELLLEDEELLELDELELLLEELEVPPQGAACGALPPIVM